MQINKKLIADRKKKRVVYDCIALLISYKGLCSNKGPFPNKGPLPKQK